MNSNVFLCVSLLVLVYCATLDGCPRIIGRREWDAEYPDNTVYMRDSVRYAIIHHGGTEPSCTTTYRCKQVVKSYQTYHMNKGWDDIGYNFVVGEDGNVYEGRGWNVKGRHAGAKNGDSIGIAVIGDFTYKTPNAAALNAVKDLLECAKDYGKLSPTYTLCGHRDVMDRTCPGTSFYEEIQTWDHYNELNRC